MIRFFCRLIGLACLAGGFVFLVYDGIKSIADQVVYVTRTGDVWIAISEKSQQVVEAWLVGHGMTWAWDPVLLEVLDAPVWLPLAVVGAIFILLGRKPRPLIGYARS